MRSKDWLDELYETCESVLGMNLWVNTITVETNVSARKFVIISILVNFCIEHIWGRFNKLSLMCLPMKNLNENIFSGLV